MGLGLGLGLGLRLRLGLGLGLGLEEVGRAMRCVASARASRGTAARVGSGLGSILIIAPDHGLSGHGHSCARHLLATSPLEEVRGRLCVHAASPRSE